MTRRLSLKRENLTELTTGELTAVAGAAPDAMSLPNKTCVTEIRDRVSDVASCRASCYNTCWACS